MSYYRGIDVSNWQGDIDFVQVRAAGIQIVYIKATEGDNYIDPFLRTYYDGARAQGLRTGFYHYLTATTADEARAQAEYFVNTLGRMTSDCLLAVDLGNKDRLSNQTFSELCDVFLTRTQELTGIGGVIYASLSTAKYDLEPFLTKYPLWVAEYGVSEPRPTGKWDTWVGWQYENTGRVSGITGNVDLDRFTDGILINSAALPAPTQPTNSPNTSRVRYYTVQAGDTLGHIAQRFGVTVADLVQWNRISNPDLIYIGQVLKIYTTQPASGSGWTTSYTVQPGDTLWKIARRYDISVPALIAANDLANTNLIYPGEILKIPAPARNASRSNPSDQFEATVVVAPRDTLYSIGRRFGTTPERLAALNGIANPDRIYPGQVLKLYASGVPEDAQHFHGSYTVREGDTLSSIARRLHTTAARLAQDNVLVNPDRIYPGQVLVVR